VIAALVILFGVGDLRSQAVGDERLLGRVADPGGGSVASAAVILKASGDVDGATRRGFSDGDGNFIFQGLLPGEYEVRVESPGFEPRVLRVVLSSGSTTLPPIRLAIAPIPDCGPDLVRPQLDRLKVSVTSSVSGYVSVGGSLARHVWVSLQRAGGIETLAIRPSGQGSFQFGNLAAGKYVLTVRLPGYADFMVRNIEVQLGTKISVREKIGLQRCANGV
jgi:hypothetical protein